MRVIVTCGPSYEPIDEVRRITNFSTGELGVMLTNRLVQAGHEVWCCQGVGATCREPVAGACFIPFSTNASLSAELEVLSGREEVGAVLHAAALSDYAVKNIRGADGRDLAAAKIPSRAGELLLTLVPALKLMPKLRGLFPQARIVGWKYELNGGPAEALAAAERQLAESRTDACVVNGAAYGPGFGIQRPGQPLVHRASKAALCDWLVQWLAEAP